jgi:hypothetical protein
MLMRGAWKEAHEPTIASIFFSSKISSVCAFVGDPRAAPPRELPGESTVT